MAIFLFILSFIPFFVGIGIWILAKTVIQGIFAWIFFVVWSIFLSAAAIVHSIDSLKKQISKEDG
jgi:hypothetical protein